MMMKSSLCALLTGALLTAAQYTATYDPNNLPDKTEADQVGTNKCGTANNQTSKCQNAYVNTLDDFCVWGAQEPNSIIGNIEQIVVAYCSKPGHGTRLFPPGTLTNAHFRITPDYVQVSGRGNFTKINIQEGDAGGELDPHGPDGLGNPHGGLLFSNAFNNSTGPGIQIHEWTNFQSYDQFCIRACRPGPRATQFCEHIYDVLGCMWNMPGDYGDGFTSCRADNGIPMGLYPQPDGSTSKFHQGAGPTPAAHPAPASSQCQTFQSADLYAAVATAFPTATITSAGSGSTSTRSGGSGTGPTSSSPASTGAAGSLRADLFTRGWTVAVGGIVLSAVFGAFTILL